MDTTLHQNKTELGVLILQTWELTNQIGSCIITAIPLLRKPETTSEMILYHLNETRIVAIIGVIFSYKFYPEDFLPLYLNHPNPCLLSYMTTAY